MYDRVTKENREFFLINILMRSIGKAGKACEVFSLVYLHDTDKIHIHTLFQYCIFMKVANALIHDDE